MNQLRIRNELRRGLTLHWWQGGGAQKGTNEMQRRAARRSNATGRFDSHDRRSRLPRRRRLQRQRHLPSLFRAGRSRRRAKDCSSASTIWVRGRRASGMPAITRGRTASWSARSWSFTPSPLAPGGDFRRAQQLHRRVQGRSRQCRRTASGLAGHLQVGLHARAVPLGHRPSTTATGTTRSTSSASTCTRRRCGGSPTCAGATGADDRPRRRFLVRRARPRRVGGHRLGGAGALPAPVRNSLPAVDAAAAFRRGHSAGRNIPTGRWCRRRRTASPAGTAWASARPRKARTITCASSCSIARSATAHYYYRLDGWVQAPC